MTGTLLDIFATLSRGQRLAVIADDGRCTYGELFARASGVAASLSAGGCVPGDRVLLLADPGVGWLASFLGTILAGAVSVPLSPLHPEAEVRALAGDADARFSLVGASLRERAPWLGAATTLDADDDARAPFSARLPPDDVALMLYTSGTTGKPKGAEITHANLATQARLVGDAWQVTPSDRLLHALPLHHMHGVAIALMTALCREATIELLPRFDRRRVWERLADATLFMAVPTMYHRLFEELDAAAPDERAAHERAATGLRLATSGSAALPVSLAERWRALTGAIPLERFGMTEIGVGTTNPLVGDRRAGTVGTPLPTVDLRLVDEQGADVPPGGVGEIWIRGPSVFRGYFRRDDANRDAFRDGWFVTGDTATHDDAGYVKILGRTSVDILKSGGYKLSALEIEEALRTHPAIADVAVVGIEDPRWGDRVVAAFVRRPGHDADLSTPAVREFAKTLLAPYKVPQEVHELTALPRNAVGKVMKPVLRTMLAGGG